MVGNWCKLAGLRLKPANAQLGLFSNKQGLEIQSDNFYEHKGGSHKSGIYRLHTINQL